MTRPTTGAQVDIGDATLMYDEAGIGDEAVVFLHAGIADRRMWDGPFEALAEAYRVLRYDLRGFGQTRTQPVDYRHYEDLRKLLEALEIRRAHLVGASLGGATALNFALRYPTRVRRLVLIAPGVYGHRFTDDATIAKWGPIDQAMRDGDTDLAAELETRLWVDGVGRGPDAIDGRLRERIRAMMIASYAAEPPGDEVPPDPLPATRLDELHAETLLLVGEHDVPDMHRISAAVADAAARAGLEVVPGTAHMLSMERPDWFTARVRRFLTSGHDGG